jgi:predicted nucleic acid-binding protein
MSAIEPQSGRCFVDTNLWLYALIAGQDQEKSIKAKEITQSINPVVSTQVINEVCVNLIKKARFSEDQTRQLIESFYNRYR